MKNSSLHTAVKAFEKRYISRMLNDFSWHKPTTAKALGIGLATLYRKIIKLGIKRKR